MRIVNFISEINQYKGKQDLYKQQLPQVLDTLKQVAMIQSTLQGLGLIIYEPAKGQHSRDEVLRIVLPISPD